MIVSVVITTFRRPAMLAELLAALAPQLDSHDAEVIVIDNCREASGRSAVEMAAHPAIRYVNERRSGVVHTRNRGVAEARGTYVLFLDDDEVPCSGWLDAWMSQADGVTDMAFGRIVPRLLGPCPPSLAGQVERAYSRFMEGPTGTDISAKWAFLGTGNAMFHKARCFVSDTPFDLRFNARGGEDVWLIRALVQQGRRPLWNFEALVEELVPAERMTLEFAQRRKFNQGQLRCILMYGPGGLGGTTRVALWMAIGAIQLVGFGAAALLMGVLDPERVPDLRCRAAGGAGKVLWRRAAGLMSYSDD